MAQAHNNFSYPVMLKLAGKKCIIIGGGVVAARKLTTLCEAGASVTCVAPSFAPELLAVAEKYQCTLVQDVYKPQQLKNAFVVIAATDSFEVNSAITEVAPCLCNNITEPHLSNFTVPSSINVGTLTVTIATGGIPGYTRLLRRYLQTKLNPAFGQFNDFLLEQRKAVKEITSSSEERTIFWRQVLNENLLLLLENENIEQAKEQIQNAVDSFRTQSQNGTR